MRTIGRAFYALVGGLSFVFIMAGIVHSIIFVGITFICLMGYLLNIEIELPHRNTDDSADDNTEEMPFNVIEFFRKDKEA